MAEIDVFLAASDVEEPDPDRQPLDDALQAAGIRAAWPRWNDPDVDWGRAAVCYPRMTWDYHRDPDGFLHWAEHVSTVSKIRNPVEVIRWNIDKRYLLELARRGVAVVPTVRVERGERTSLSELRRAHGWGRVVIKPSVSCGSWETYDLAPDDDGESRWSRLLADRAMLVQPFVESVETSGERCAVMIDGEVTHVIRKNPRFAGGVESTSGPFEPTARERQLIQNTLRVVGRELDYARIDMVAGADGKPMIAELELIEPSLYFNHCAGALDRFIGLLQRHVQQA